MAIIWYEHFDLYGSTERLNERGYNNDNNSTAYMQTGANTARNGGGCFEIAGFGFSYFGRNFGVDIPVCIQGIALNFMNGPSGGDTGQGGLHFGSAADRSHVRVLGNNAFGFNVFLGNTLVGSTPSGRITQGHYGYLEAKVVAGSAGSGSVVVRYNNQEILTVNNLTISPIRSCGVGKSNNAQWVRFDDWVILDNTGSYNNDFIGDTFVLVALPNADGTINDWTPSSGSDRFAMVNTATPNDSTFISADTVGNAQEFAHAALNLPVGGIAAIAVQSRARKEGAGGAEYQLGLASGAATGMSSNIALGTGLAAHSHIQNVDPETGLPWTQVSAQAARSRLVRA